MGRELAERGCILVGEGWASKGIVLGDTGLIVKEGGGDLAMKEWVGEL